MFDPAAEIALPPLLPDGGYVTPIAPVHSGKSASTHLAQVQMAGAVRRAYVKHFDPATQPRGLFNELVGSLVCRSMGTPTPEAALVNVPAAALNAMFPSIGASKETLCFASVDASRSAKLHGAARAIYSASALSLHEFVRRLRRCPRLPNLVAADAWMGNGDRHPLNLVFSGPDSFFAIDHSHAFGGSDWKVENLDPEATYPNQIAQALAKHGTLDKLSSQTLAAAADAERAYRTIWSAMNELSSAGPDAYRAHYFLWKRADCGNLSIGLARLLNLLT